MNRCSTLTTGHFDRRVVKFTRAHPELKNPLAKVLKNLEADPFIQSLRLHPLSGELEGLHAVNLTYVYRITLTLRITKKEIILLDIGSHDEVYR